jgi:hypothetical protein
MLEKQFEFCYKLAVRETRCCVLSSILGSGRLRPLVVATARNLALMLGELFWHDGGAVPPGNQLAAPAHRRAAEQRQAVATQTA